MIARSLIWFIFLLPTAAVRGEENQKVRVLLLGDSTVIGTYGREVFPKADHRENVVREMLGAEGDLPPVEVVNRGQNGDMVSLLLARPMRYEKDAAKQAPFDFICLRFGLDDVRHLKEVGTECPANYRKLLGKLRE